MDPRLQPLIEAARQWARETGAAGWLAAADLARLESVEDGTPGSLFDSSEHRPLVVAFFGGTGVGKSTLLNRLAGQEIARTGAERPTSREVSVYVHESVRIHQLPAHFPVDRVRVAHHQNEKRRQVLWIDMPDIDSTEPSNRQWVLEWLPHVDVVIYVVSPERYRDDKGWRLLRSHGHEHAWLFVMNQWDRGQPEQIDDFRRQLADAGFADPIILRTDSREEIQARGPDDFDTLERTVQSLADEHIVRQLEQRGVEIRLAALEEAVRQCLDRLGADEDAGRLEKEWERIWQDARAKLLQELEWPIRAVARAFVTRDASPLRKSVDLGKQAVQPPTTRDTEAVLWDDWAQTRFEDALDQFIVEAGADTLPVGPLKAGLDNIRSEARALLLAEAQQALRRALANPGNVGQRFVLKLTGLLAILLPLAAIGWVCYQVVTAYYDSALHHTEYLGVNFAVHSALLIAISWLLPFFINRQLKPSAERVAVKGLRNGVLSGLDLMEEKVTEAIHRAQADRRAHIKAGQELLARLTSPIEAQPRRQDEGPLSRMLSNRARRR
jgi:GTPase SAR1 family protein